MRHMGALDRLRDYIAITVSRKAASLPLQRVSAVGGRHSRPDYAAFSRRVNEAYKGNPVVAACIGTRANTLNEAPLVVEDILKGELNRNHSLSRLFAAPNPHMSQTLLWQYVSTYLDIGGNAYLVKGRDSNGGIVSLYPYHDGQCVPVLSPETGWIDHYDFDLGENKVRHISAADVIHMRSYYIDPLNPHLGISPIVVAAIGIDTYNELMNTLYSIAKNGGIIPGILKSVQRLDDGTVEQLKIQFAEKIGGRGEESGRPIVLSGDITYQELGQSVKDLASAEQFAQYEIAICGAFRVDPAVAMTGAGLTSSTYANKEIAFKEYTNLTRIPTWNSWEEQLMTGFRGEYNNIRLEFDTSSVAALAADPESTSAPILSQFSSNLLTVDEARQALGYPALEDEERGGSYADELVVPAAAGFFAAPEGETKTEGDGGEAPLNYYSFDEKEQETYWKSANQMQQKYETELQPYVADGMKSMLRMATSSKAAVTDVARINVDTLVKQFMSATASVRKSMLEDIYRAAVVAANASPADFITLIDVLEREMAKTMTEALASSYGTAKSEIGAVISGNVGATAEVLQQALLEKVKTLSTSRAATIARTTVRATSSKTQLQTWGEMNKERAGTPDELVKVWVTRRDDKVRPEHRAMDGLWVDLGGMFPEIDKEGKQTGKSLEAPGLGLDVEAGAVANCRCVMRPVKKSKVKR